MPFGVMGGQYQPVGQTHVLTNILDYGCDVQEAIDMPRGLHYEASTSSRTACRPRSSKA